jgi:hypothetical protein
MKQFQDWDAQQRSQQRGPAKEAVKCKSCQSEWFEQIKATKIDMNIICTLGQHAPEDNGLAYSQILLRCLRCGDLQELPVNISGAHKGIQDSYSDLIETLEKPVEKKDAPSKG